MNQATFQRSLHDKENPYVMISREMAQDRTISPKAKGVLLYLLSLPSDWKVYHSQLEEGLGVGEEYITGAMDELISAGYADRSRERVKGLYQPYNYTIREFKKSLPNRENQPGSTSPVNQELQSKHSISTKETTTKTKAASPSVVVFPEKEKKGFKKPAKIYDCLKKSPVPLLVEDMEEISARNAEEDVINGLEYTIANQEKIKTTFVQYLKMCCAKKLKLSEKTKSKTNHEKIAEIFTDGELYNSAECILKNDVIAFQRGLKHEQLKIDKYFTWSRLRELCKTFGIVLP